MASSHDPQALETLPDSSPPDAESAFFIDRRQGVGIVLDGAVDIFAVPLQDGRVAGTRRHLYRVAIGEAVFGLGLADKRDGLGLLAVCIGDAQLQWMAPEQWNLLLRDPDLRENLADWIDCWLRGLCAGLFRERMPRRSRGFESGLEFTLKRGESAYPVGRVLWVEAGEGRVRWMGRALAPGTVLPLAPSTWLEADGEARLACLGGTPEVPIDRLRIALETFHVLLAEALIDLGAREREAWLARLKRKSANDERLVSAALHELAGILAPRSVAALARSKTGVPLFDALERVFAAGRMSLRLPSKIPDGLDTRALMEMAARASAVNLRQVALTAPGWWRGDQGPLLAFARGDNRPLALLPNAAGGYRWVDPAGADSGRVDEAFAAGLDATAIMFFRTFPARPVTLRGLLRFGLAGAGADLARLAALGILGGVLGIFVPYATGHLIDSVIPGADRGQLAQIALLLLATVLASASFEFTRWLALLRVEGKLGVATHAAIIDRVLRLPPDFFRDYSAGDLALRAFGIDTLLHLVTGATLMAILQGVFSLASFLYLFCIDLKLALVAALLALAALLPSALLNGLRLRYERRLFGIEGQLAGRVFQFLNGIAKLRVAGAEARAFANWAGDFAEKKRLAYGSQRLVNRLTVFEAAYPVFASLVFFVFIGFLPLPIGTGDFLAFNAAFTQFLTAMLATVTALSLALNAVPLYERAKPILATLPELDEAKSPPGELSGEIELSHVGFGYGPDGPPVLKDINLRIEPGEFVAFVGASGSGKSTLLRMLLGFEQPTFGAVYYDGQDLAGLDIRAVRRQLGVVLQNSKLMPGDIFSNIVGSLPLSLDDAWEAARLAGLEQDIRALPPWKPPSIWRDFRNRPCSTKCAV
jgi:NHLM bacteriocin system ABC transporter ATP-binding protein